VSPPARGADVEVEVEGRSLRLSNLEKVLWPRTGFTKGQMIDYYRRISATMVPHLRNRPLTLRRWPDGVEAASFFQKNCPSHRPGWMEPLEMGGVRYCVVSEAAALVWAANLASIELHPLLAQAPALDCPTVVVFDLDPGPPADVLTCALVALRLRELLERLSLKAWPKTSGGKGLQLYLPLNTPATYEVTRGFAHALARLVERDEPDLVVSTMDKAKRKAKVLIDWSQNSSTKTTVAAYSLRAEQVPTVSTPVSWAEVEDALAAGEASKLRFGPQEVVERVERWGDLFSPVLELRQRLPA
jgi:bifunctional non-homologous end joining protein LigD